MAHETPVRRWLRRATAGTTAVGLIALTVPAVGPALGADATPGRATSPVEDSGASVQLVSHRKPHPNRKLKRYRVRPGDTPSGIAVRYHAWTAQLMRINHSRTLYVGDVILVPVVPRAARECTKHRHHRSNVARHKPGKHAAKARPGKAGAKAGPKPGKAAGKRDARPQHKPRPPHHVRHARGWHHREASRAAVRRVIVKKATRVGVNPDLALAIAWQESGWQHDRVSSAGAVGAMQIMPGTGQWMSTMVGRRLNIRDLHDNVTAGVVLLRWLRDSARPRYAAAGYYQGLAGVRRHGMYSSTRRYVANVMALKRRIDRGWNPA